MRNFQAECPEGYVEVMNTTCQTCGKDCSIYQQLWTEEDWEWWCYCPTCDIETWHLCYIPKEETK